MYRHRCTASSYRMTPLISLCDPHSNNCRIWDMNHSNGDGSCVVCLRAVGCCAHTDRMRSPFRSSPQRSAGPPARMKEMKIPSPSSPPTMLNPRPVDPRCSTTRLGSLEETQIKHIYCISIKEDVSKYLTYCSTSARVEPESSNLVDGCD